MAARKGEKFTWKPLFDEGDCIQAANQIVTVSYNRKVYIGPDIQLEFFDAGHILGSAFALFTVRGFHASSAMPRQIRSDDDNSVRILYTGDLGRKHKPIVRTQVQTSLPDYIFLEVHTVTENTRP